MKPHNLPEPQQPGPAGAADAETASSRNSGAVGRDSAIGTVPAADSRQGEPENAEDEQNEGSVPRSQRQGGRPPMAPLERLTEVIAAAHPDPEAITRDSARKALTEAGLGAGTLRLTEAIAQARGVAQARQHPDRPEDQHSLADRT